MITLQDIEMLATLLQRASVNHAEATWANGIMDELRVEAARAELSQKKDDGDD